MEETHFLWLIIAFILGFFSKHIIQNLVCKNACSLVEGLGKTNPTVVPGGGGNIISIIHPIYNDYEKTPNVNDCSEYNKQLKTIETNKKIIMKKIDECRILTGNHKNSTNNIINTNDFNTNNIINTNDRNDRNDRNDIINPIINPEDKNDDINGNYFKGDLINILRK